MHRKIAGLVVSMQLITSVAAAQGCNELLRGGVFDALNQTSGRFSADQWHQAWCNGEVQQTSSASSSSGGLKLGFLDLSLGMSASDARSFQTLYRSQFCGTNSSGSTDLSKEAIVTRTASPTLINAYVECRRVENAGLITQFSTSPDGRVFTVSMKYSKPFQTSDAPRVKSIAFAPTIATCQGSLAQAIHTAIRLDADNVSMQCQRTVDLPLSVLVETDVGAFTRDLAPVVPPPTQEELVLAALPRGTILLWYDAARIPKGFHVCDGQAGTPDLRDRYPIGTAELTKIGQMIGTDAHTHTVTIAGATGATSQSAPGPDAFAKGAPSRAEHTHPINIDATTASASWRPPSTRVVFIMKVQ